MSALITTKHLNYKKSALLAVLIIGAAGLYAPIINAAPIYKVIDEQTGQVTFTDQPQSYEGQDNKQVIETNITTGNNTNSSSNSNNSTSNSTSSDNTNSTPVTNNTQSTSSTDTATRAPVRYQLAIVEPSEERAYQRPAQTIVINLQLSPTLQGGDSVSIYFDGNEIARGLSASIASLDVLPGQHAIQAVVRDKNGAVLNQVQRTVYVIQNTAVLQNKRKIQQQLLAYQNLPWHQKMLLKMRQKNPAKP